MKNKITLSIAVVLGLMLFGNISTPTFGASTPLKAERDKILNSKTVRDLRCDRNANCVDNGIVTQYTYATDTVVPVELNEDVSLRTENSQKFRLGKNAKGEDIIMAKFYSGQAFTKVNDTWFNVEYATATPQDFSRGITTWYSVKKALADTFAPTNDGSISTSNSDFATAHDATTGTFASSDAYVWTRLIAGPTYGVSAYFGNYDTSSIPDTATILTTTLDLYGDDRGLDTRTYNVYSSTASDTIVDGDFDLRGSTAYATAIADSSWNTAGYNTFTFNATGMTNVSKTGISKFTVREVTHDVGNTAPASANAYIHILTVLTSGTSQDPVLTVTYSTGGDTSVESDLIFFE